MVESLTIQQLKLEISQYRENKSRRNQPIPVEIWDKIRLAAETIPVSVLCQELNLDSGGLRNQLARKRLTSAPLSPARVSVVKVCAEVPQVKKNTKFTLVCPQGWSLTLEGASAQETIRVFHELRRGGE